MVLDLSFRLIKTQNIPTFTHQIHGSKLINFSDVCHPIKIMDAGTSTNV